MYAIAKDDKLVEWPIHSIHQRFPQTSFPSVIESQSLPEGVVEVSIADAPDHDSSTHKLELLDPQLIDGAWVQVYSVVELSEQEANDQAEFSKRRIENQKAHAYRTESDPLFFKAQRGEATHQEWLDKVAEIKARYPA
jgi:hypothetical protein